MLDLDEPLFWVVDEVVDLAQCRELCQRIDAGDPKVAPISTAGGFVMRPDIRNNERFVFDDGALARELYSRVVSTLPDPLSGATPCGVNERFRCYRYRPGMKFGPHTDGSFVRNPNERSLLSFLVYLNDDYVGGETTLLDLDFSLKAKPGQALLFQHYLLHEGAEVGSGTKYVLRSDVMYRQS